MKAKAGFLMLLIGMMCFTGFGTTTDLADNSTADVIQMDTSVSVVMISVDSPENFQAVDQQNSKGFEQSNSKYLDASIAAAIKTDAQLANRVKDLFAIADNELFSKQERFLMNELLDVGWHTNYDYLLTSNKIKDSGGKLSLFYI